ncbi:serine/threonine-protein kinase [Actinorugispora endophytica]|uniref:non-specific serine/threonine protein kinase n=1 Tax=Actinorugispora endophytica TaxID=1605990 RepID=A0A4R6US37_9ACTN|nr:serine/threonine-protein kinase [Actinorugispora endophytica]TDQ46144.1 serine/threonine protein kinase [Actinorugispora endophytica]
MHSGVVLAERYRLDRQLGQGGMGEVWEGFDPQLHRPVAVKLLSSALGEEEALVRRFQQEARIAANIQHPGIAAVFDFGRHEGRLFLVMELMRGRDLAAVLAGNPDGLPVEQVVSIATQAADALQAAHAQRVVHRDIKPANLFLLDTGHVKICDFGVARLSDATTQLTAVGSTLGTPAFMPPEQWSNDNVGEHSDVYAFGCVLHALLTGGVPFTGSLPSLMGQHLTKPPPSIRTTRPDVPEALDELVGRLMAKDPADRPSSSGLDALIRRAAHPAGPVEDLPPTRIQAPAPPPEDTGRSAPTAPPPSAPAGEGAPPRQPAPADEDPATLFDRGLRLRERGDVAEAEQWYRRAAETGHTDAMFTLGLLHRDRGDAAGAEQWYRGAADSGDTDAMANLGDLLKERGDVAEAEQWYRRAAETGHTGSMAALGNLLYKRGDAAGAEQWWRRAAETGHARAMGLLGDLLDGRGDAAGAEQWYRRAAETGHVDAMAALGGLLEHRRDMAGAEHWYRLAAQAGDIDTMVTLGNLLNGRGSAAEARYWWRRASETGNARAVNSPGIPR